MRRCETCRHCFDRGQVKTEQGEVIEYAYCRKYPPTPLSPSSAGFPIVQPFRMKCGQYSFSLRAWWRSRKAPRAQ